LSAVSGTSFAAPRSKRARTCSRPSMMVTPMLTRGQSVGLGPIPHTTAVAGGGLTSADPCKWNPDTVELLKDQLGTRSKEKFGPALTRYCFAKLMCLASKSKMDLAPIAARMQLVGPPVSCWRPSGGGGVGGFCAGAGHMQSGPNAPCRRQQIANYCGHPRSKEEDGEWLGHRRGKGHRGPHSTALLSAISGGRNDNSDASVGMHAVSASVGMYAAGGAALCSFLFSFLFSVVPCILLPDAE